MSLLLSDLRSHLATFLAEQTGASVSVTNLRHLTGGASRESWAVDVEVHGEAGTHALVLRRDMGGVIYEQALTREQEFRLLEVAYRAGVMVPRPRWLCADSTVLGAPFFLMDRLEGESVGSRVVRRDELAEARKHLPQQMGEQLARIHRIDFVAEDLDFLPRSAVGKSPAQTALENSARQLWHIGEPHPALELALCWLQKNAPISEREVLVHGDFRVGNLMVGAEGLRGVFDWEFAHVGDPSEDLAWSSVRSWRFGHDHLRLGGIGQPDEFFEAYEQASGWTVNRPSVDYWEILGNFRWAVGCITQAHRHLSGQTSSLELASLGRRTAEMELELLDLMERRGA